MRALWVTHIPPDREGGGGHIRQAHLIRALAEVAEIELIVAGSLRDDWVRTRLSKVTEIPVENGLSHRTELGRKLFDLRQLVAGREPREVLEHGHVREAIAPVLQDALPADVVFVEYPAMADLVDCRRPDEDTAWTLTFHNLGSVMGHQAAACEGAGRRARLFRHDARVSARFESRIVARYDRVVAVSDNDASVLRQRAPGATIDVVPNGVDVDRYQVTPLPDAPVVVFTGALYTAPNLDGVRWFADQIAPLVRAQNPDTRIVVVGARPLHAVVRACRDAGIELHADVPATRAFIEQARVVVVPLRIGSGTRLKALEAFAAGRPVVATSVGLEGLHYIAGRHAVVADAPGPFADAIVRLFGDRTLARRLATEGRRLVERQYAWPGIGQHFVELVTAGKRDTAPAMPSPEVEQPR